MASEAVSGISAESVAEDVLKQNGTGTGTRTRDLFLSSRKQDEAATRRHEAAGWLRKMLGPVGVRELAEEPSEEEFRLGLRNGIILCNALNMVQPGAIPKVVEAPPDSALVPDGAALSAYQYFENVRNFLVAMEELCLPTFEASDLGQGGKVSRVVNCVLVLKSYNERKQGRNGSWKYGGVAKPASSAKYFVRKNTEPFMNSLLKRHSMDKIQDDASLEQSLEFDFSMDPNEMATSHSLNMLVRTILTDKKPEEVPVVVGAILSKFMQEFERRIASQNELTKITSKDLIEDNSGNNKTNVFTAISSVSDENKILIEKENLPCQIFTEKESLPCQMEEVENNSTNTGAVTMTSSNDEEIKDKLKEALKEKFEEELREKIEEALKEKFLKQGAIFDWQKREIQELKDTLQTARSDVEFMKIQYNEQINNLGKHLQVLAHAASGYHKVLEENRKLYNQVQDLKGNIRVYCRIRPFLPGESSKLSTVGDIDEGNISIVTPLKYGKDGRKSFTFNKVFGPSATQAEVFTDTRPLIRSILDGYNVCIFAYGQTGSGKTYTMTGPKELTEDGLGVNYRALNDLFNLSAERRETFLYEISVQMMEIYNEQVRDLLTSDGVQKKLEIRTSPQNGLSVPDATLIPVTSTSDVIQLMNLGHKNRAVSATAMNDRSSRSHSCLTIHVQGRDLTSGAVLRGCMHLVDLAGSERVDKSEVRGDRLKEAQHINKSLAALGDVISALAQKSQHVPYRNSKLTQLLQDSLGGQAKTLMFVHISPDADAIGETLSTLKFAERVATIELGAARLNKDSGELKELKQQIASLKAALANKEGEDDHLRTTMSSPDIYRMKSASTSPTYLNHRKPIEEAENIEGQRTVEVMQKRVNLDFQELLISNEASCWPEKFSGLKKPSGYKDIGSGDWEEDNLQASDFFYQGGTAADIRSQANSVATDDSDDFATSDSSEQDMQLQFNLSKMSSSLNGVSMIKKPQANAIKSPELRKPSNSLAPPSARKASNGPSRTPSKTTKQQVNSNGTDAKRSENIKVAGRK